ncbi:MAG: hypothetical protein ABJ239_09460 [Erythrobacter sp.]
MIDAADAGFGDQLAGNSKFVIGQYRDQLFAHLNRARTIKQQDKFMPRAGKGNAGPGLFLMRDQFGLALRQRRQCLANAIPERAAGAHFAALILGIQRQNFSSYGQAPADLRCNRS